MGRTRGATAGGALLVLGAIAASAVSGCDSHGMGFAACAPRTAETISGATSRIEPPLAHDPSAVKLCIYESGLTGGTVARLVGSATLTGATARTFVRLIDTGGASGSGCDTASPVVMSLRYGRAVVSAKAAGCEPERLKGPHGVSLTSAAVLGELYGQPMSGRGLPSPSIVGDSLAGAVTRLVAFYRHRRRDVGEFFGAGAQLPVVLHAVEYDDPGVRFGTVVFQTPLPSLPNDALDQTVALVATPPAPRCTVRQLVGYWFGDGFGTGNTFGSISFGDRSARPCSLTGRIAVRGVDRTGAPDTPTLSSRLPDPFVLSPDARPAHISLDSESTMTGLIGVAGDSRDGPGPDGLCAHETVPAAWRITTDGVVFDVANGPDPRRLDGHSYGSIMAGRSDGNLPFFSCRGTLTPGLESPPQLTNG